MKRTGGDQEPYSTEFYARREEGVRRSAREVIPLVLELLQPRSVVDVGCGTGTWLAVFQERGVEEVLGIDGDYVDRHLLQIKEKFFLPADLKRPIRLARQFDLVVSLEVAEHLPPESAETLVESLTRLGPVILFSAAIPFQGGLNHLNEQWPEYWARLFHARNYLPLDYLRKKIWSNDQVWWWYAQNILLYVERTYLAAQPRLRELLDCTEAAQLSLVHPGNYLHKVKFLSDYMNLSLKKLVPVLPGLILSRAKFRISQLLRFVRTSGSDPHNMPR